MKNVNIILKNVLNDVKPTENELKNINESLKIFLDKMEKNKKRLKIAADIFVGGSSAKKTIIKKDRYDIDIFVRFEKKHLQQDLSSLTEKILSGIKKERIHGSRDYFKVQMSKSLFFEIVPVKKIKNQKEADNVTDLSYFHVNYIKKKVKGKVLDEILLAKAFCHATGTYGAESYIKGFSGYALELLLYNYSSFTKFVNAMAKVKPGEKLVIDIEKQYKNKNTVLMDVNAAKLTSPIVLIDPTYKQRNVLAALSEETFRKFQKECKSFLSRPSEDSFEQIGVDFEAMKKNAQKKRYDFVILEAATDKQEGDIAGSKLLKFYNHLGEELKGYFEVKEKVFDYQQGKKATFAFVAKKRLGVIRQGPRLKDKEHVKRFKARHKKTFTKGDRIYSKENIDFTLKEFIMRWKNSNTDKIKGMFILSFKVLV